jgi:GNAT superfamily N-acetyltransferase
VIARVTTDLSIDDRYLFRGWFVAEIGRRYPLSTEITADWLLNLTKQATDPAGYFTLRKTIWKAEGIDGETLGFTVATEKRGGSIKFGPSLVASEHRNKGVGRALRLAVEEKYKARGFRKAYSTTNLRNAPGIYYLTGAGYAIEGHLRSHYQAGVDEVVLGKLLANAPSPSASSGTEIGSVLLRRLQPYYDGLDSSFEESIFRVSGAETGLHDETFYTTKRKVLFGDPTGSFCVTTPKREGAVKLGPVLANDQSGLRNLVREVTEFYESRGARKLYCIVPFQESWMVLNLRSAGWDLEGALREPYRPYCDMAVLSLFLPEARYERS